MGGSAIGVRFDVTVRGSLFLWRIAQEISRGVIFYDKFRCDREVKKRRCLYISSFFFGGNQPVPTRVSVSLVNLFISFFTAT